MVSHTKKKKEEEEENNWRHGMSMLFTYEIDFKMAHLFIRRDWQWDTTHNNFYKKINVDKDVDKLAHFAGGNKTVMQQFQWFFKKFKITTGEEDMGRWWLEASPAKKLIRSHLKNKLDVVV
jgi:hypothetical protein